MKYLKYLIQFIMVIIFFIIFKILGPNKSSYLGGKLFEIIGPFFRSKKLIYSNIKKAIPNIKSDDLNNIVRLMWNNYGRIFAEYVFIKDFRNGKLRKNIKIQGEENLQKIIKENKQVIFISAHFSNFELMAMYLDKSDINLSALYRPLNNIFLNKIMENIRKKYICKNQIKKGISGLREMINLNKNNFSTALMIDQRVSEGISSNFFNQKALTTTIPAQLVKKFNLPIIPIHIERIEGINFKITINKAIFFSREMTTQYITDELNKIIEIMILKNPEQWIWSHNRWK